MGAEEGNRSAITSQSDETSPHRYSSAHQTDRVFPYDWAVECKCQHRNTRLHTNRSCCLCYRCLTRQLFSSTSPSIHRLTIPPSHYFTILIPAKLPRTSCPAMKASEPLIGMATKETDDALPYVSHWFLDPQRTHIMM